MNKMKFLHCMIALSIFSTQFLSSVELESMSVPSAEAKLCVTVVDYEGHPVEQAKVRGSFHDGKSKWREIDEQLTDSNGYAEIKGMSWDFDIGVTVEKDGYYETSVDYSYLSRNPIKGAHMAHKKWIPYGKEEVIVLKEIRSPIPMLRFCTLDLRVPKQDIAYGYDMEYGSFVAPLGDGKHIDFYVTFSSHETEEVFERYAKISFPNESDGAYIVACTPNTLFRSPYRASLEDGDYLSEIVFTRKTMKFPDGRRTYEFNDLSKDQCIILRTRTRRDENGKLVSAHYGKIYGPISMEGGVIEWNGASCRFLFNPAENDNNLESDGFQHGELQKGKRRLNGDYL